MAERLHPSLETTGRQWAQERADRMRAHEVRFIPFIQVKNSEILHLPRLATGEPANPRSRSADVRFDPISGEIFTTRWQTLKTFIRRRTGKRSVRRPAHYTLINWGEDAPILPEGPIPQEAETAYLVVQKLGDIETALRQQIHIQESVTSFREDSENTKITAIFSWTDSASARLRNQKVTPAVLDQLAGEAADLLERCGLTTALDQRKKQMTLMLAKACQLDRLGRVNPLVSRTRLRAAFLQASARSVIVQLVGEKESKTFETLAIARELTRLAVRSAVRELEEVLSEFKKGDPEQLAAQIRMIVYHYLVIPKVNPYLVPARIAAILLVGCREKKKDLNRQVLGNDLAEDLFALEPVDRSLREIYQTAGDKKESQLFGLQRRIIWAKDILQQSLEEGAFLV